MPVLQNISQLAVCPNNDQQGDLGIIEQAALVWEGSSIAWVGPQDEVPAQYQSLEVLDAQGKIAVPGLIDAHTHLAFGGWRSDEFEMRILGKSYLEIAKAGGGISSTVSATRAASAEELKERGRAALDQMLELGVTSVECKSGYGLNEETELRLLQTYSDLNSEHPITLVPTFLGAHMVPEEFKSSRQEYIELLCRSHIPKVCELGLAEFCDIFVEESAFSAEEARTILSTAAEHGLKLKLHVDQFTDIGGASLAAELDAVSADHLEQISDQGISDMKERGVIAVTLPIATLYTFQPPLNARRLIDGGVPVAIATDFNPGSAPSYHLHFAMVLACTTNRMTPSEALKGVTIYAARAIDRQENIGSLEVGKQADLCLLDILSINHWMYNFQANVCRATFKDGALVAGSLQ